MSTTGINNDRRNAVTNVPLYITLFIKSNASSFFHAILPVTTGFIFLDKPINLIQFFSIYLPEGTAAFLLYLHHSSLEIKKKCNLGKIHTEWPKRDSHRN